MLRGEQESTVTHIRDEPWVYIYSSNPVHLRKLRKNSRVTEISQGNPTWGRFRVAVTDFDPVSGFKRQGKRMTESQRQAAAERLRAAREVKQ